MKLILSLFTIHFSLFTLSASAAIPLKWTVETSRATPAQFEAYQGETLFLEATLQSYGKPLEAPLNYSLYWQTNGMGNAWWSTNCTPLTNNQQLTTNNLLLATWTPSMETGAKVYNCFIGQPGTIYHAAFQLRLRPSPGAVPNELPLPQKVIDFAKVTVLNPPWSGGGGGVDTNAVREIVRPMISSATNAVPRIVMGSSEIRADLTAKVVIGRKWEPDSSVTREPPEYGDIKYGDIMYSPAEGWICEAYMWNGSKWESYGGYNMYGDDKYNPDATELTFPDDVTVTHRVPATAETRLATTNQLPTASQLLTDEQRTEIAKVKDKADEFTAWEFYKDGVKTNDVRFLRLESFIDEGVVLWDFWYEFLVDGEWLSDDVVTELDLSQSTYINLGPPTYAEATRKRVLRTGDAATPQELTDAISTNNQAFVSAVRSIAPPSSPFLRVHDTVLNCWWVGRMVNGVINWEVE